MLRMIMLGIVITTAALGCRKAKPYPVPCAEQKATDDIDPVFLPYIDHLRSLLKAREARGFTDMPSSRLETIIRMRYVETQEEMKQLRAQADPPPAPDEDTLGYAEFIDCLEETVYRDIRILRQPPENAKLEKLVIYHELLHLYFFSHSTDGSGIMRSKNLAEIIDVDTDELLDQAINDSKYKKLIKEHFIYLNLSNPKP